MRQGQVVSLIGASRSAKTTLLRCVNMPEEHDGGDVLLDGEPVGSRVEGSARWRLGEAAVSAQRAHRHGVTGLQPVPAHDRRGQDAVRMVVYVTDMFRFHPIANKVQEGIWGSGPYPPRTIIEVQRLNQDNILEVEGTFAIPAR